MSCKVPQPINISRLRNRSYYNFRVTRTQGFQKFIQIWPSMLGSGDTYTLYPMVGMFGEVWTNDFFSDFSTQKYLNNLNKTCFIKISKKFCIFGFKTDFEYFDFFWIPHFWPKFQKDLLCRVLFYDLNFFTNK